MDSICCKSGFLQKAGKHTFQAWRKRWFILGNDILKYYNPSEEYNDSNLLGSIQMVEIQSVKPSKEKKHSFVIITRSRTYNMSAKSDMERDDWIIAIRNTSSNQRRSSADSEEISSSLYDEIGSSKNANACNTTGIYAQIHNLGDNAVKNEVNNSNEVAIYDQIGGLSAIKIPPATKDPPIVKPRAQTDITNEHYSTPPQKPRAFSEGVLNVEKVSACPHVHSVLQNMSIVEFPNEEMEFIYHEIDKNLDKGSFGSDDEGDEDDEDGSVSNMTVEFSLPKPRGGSQTYAFDEIKRLSKTWGDCGETGLDLHEMAKSKDLNIDAKEEYPAIMVLNSYFNGEDVF